MNFTDIQRAIEWGLTAQFLESKMDSSVLGVICQAVISERKFTPYATAIEWALSTGASMKMLEANSGLFFELTSVDGASSCWKLLLQANYSLERVVAKLKGNNSRVTSKLGLLCSAPYCMTKELPELIKLLLDHGQNPDERDSEGFAPLGRLNEQLKLHEAGTPMQIPMDACLTSLVDGVQTLLDGGASIESILPTPEAHAAKYISDRIKAKSERQDLLHHVAVPTEDGVKQSPKTL